MALVTNIITLNFAYDLYQQKDCVIKCKEDQFQCEHGHCIPVRWHCDGETDCLDSSDEESCEQGN